MTQHVLVSELLEGFDNIFGAWGDIKKPLTEAEIRAYKGPIPDKLPEYVWNWFKPRKEAEGPYRAYPADSPLHAGSRCLACVVPGAR